MIKYLFLLFAFLWLAFLGYLVLQPKERKATDAPKPSTVEWPVEQKVEMPLSATVPEPTNFSEEIPFAPMEEVPAVSPAETNKVADPPISSPKKEMIEVSEEKERVEPDDSVFGLVCTLVEPIPSRFRLAGWKGRKLVELEDLEKPKSSDGSYPRHWLNLRVPYRELINPNTNESFFKPGRIDSGNVRLVLQSFEVQDKVLSYSNLPKPTGYLILRDLKVGGPSYRIDSDDEAPLTDTYRIHFEQANGPNKFFHDLTGKRSDYKFGIKEWGYEYQIIKAAPGKGQFTVLRKNLKTFQLQEKVLLAPIVSD